MNALSIHLIVSPIQKHSCQIPFKEARTTTAKRCTSFLPNPINKVRFLFNSTVLQIGKTLWKTGKVSSLARKIVLQTGKTLWKTGKLPHTVISQSSLSVTTTTLV